MKITVHGTCVRIKGQGVLLRGPSGSGKSDLALRLIDRGAELVADDQVVIAVAAGAETGGPVGVQASAPAALTGLIEARGIGLLHLPACGPTPLTLLIDLVAPEAVERMPEARLEAVLGVAVPAARLAPFSLSAPLHVEYLAAIAAGDQPVLR